MPNYETVFILKPTLSNEDAVGVLEKVKGLIASNNGEIILSDNWGRKRLAYNIKKEKEGNYYLLHFSADANVVGVLTNFFKTNDFVLKHMTLKMAKPFKKKEEPKKEEVPVVAAVAAAAVAVEKPATVSVERMVDGG